MWLKVISPQYFRHCSSLNLCLPEESIKILARHITFLSPLPLLRKTSNSEVPDKGFQHVLKKIESDKNGRTMIKIYPPPSRMESQSILMPGPERIRACAIMDEPAKWIDSLDSGINNICDVVIAGLEKTTNGECLGIRDPPNTGDYKWISYKDVIQKMNNLGSGLVNLGLDPSQKTMVGICTKTRPEFILTALACSNYSMIVVPLYHCFGMEAISQIISQVEMEAVIVETPDIAANIIKQGNRFPNLKHLILIDDDDVDDFVMSNTKYNIISLKDLEEIGKLHPAKENRPKPDDLLCLCYTSGTTGEPKGVMVSHRNVMSCIASLDFVLKGTISTDRSIICYLPCAHIYEIVNEIFCLYHGGRLGFYSGETEGLLSDIQALKPTVLPLVPKLMNLIYSAVRKQIFPFPIKKRLFHLALHQKQRDLKRGLISKTTIWDRFIFSKVQAQLGGRTQLVFSSSAPVCKEVMQFFRCSMGCLVFEVYGLSEVGASTMTLMSESGTGSVGAPLPCNHVKLVSIPEMSYDAKDNVGEICIKGANIFKGYFKNSTATEEVIDSDGWYHTGDIGKWLPNGTLSIIDRKKNIFKMSQGEYIIPEKTEGVYMQSPIVSQVYVDGDPNQDFTVGIIVPDKNTFIQWAKRKGFTNADFETLCQDKDVKRAVLTHLIKLGNKKHLKTLQQVGNCHLVSEPFSQDNGLLTPTLKLKRSVARKMFELVFEELYAEGNLRLKYSL